MVSGGVTTHRHYIQAGNELIALYTTRSNGTKDLRYLFRDHLGSIDAVTNRAGSVPIIERLSYDAWGKRRAADWTDASGPIASAVLPRGFTDHEHLDSVGLIHMDGRVYDPTLARYVSADPIVPDPEDSQSLNRYSYVLNNPLSLTDPSGLFSIPFVSDAIDEIGGALVDAAQFVFDNPQVIIAIGVGAVTGFAAYGVLGPGLLAATVAGGIGGFTTGLIASGGDLNAALIGGAMGAAFAYIGVAPTSTAMAVRRAS